MVRTLFLSLLLICTVQTVWAQVPARKKTPNYISRNEDFLNRRTSPSLQHSLDRYYFNAWKETEKLRNRFLGKKGNPWTPVGPFGNDPLTGIGRVNSVTFDPLDSATIYICVAQGGVWKSTNSGASWTSISGDLPVLRTSSLAVHPVHPDTMYLAVGDFAYLGHNLYANESKRHSHYGLGVYKSGDGGQSWKPTGLSFLQTDFEGSLTCKVMIHPLEHNRLIAVGETGCYLSDNGGTSWTRTDSSLFWDLEISPDNPEVLYASTGYLTVYNHGSAGILKSYDFGKTWQKSVVPFAEQGEVQRIELAVAPTDPSRLYAVASDEVRGCAGFYVSTDSGLHFTTRIDSTYMYNILGWELNDDPGGQGNYDLALLVDKDNADKVYVGGVNIWVTEDAGVNWKPSTYWRLNYYFLSLHADIHELKQHPNGRIFASHDGGVSGSDYVVGDDPDSLSDGSSIKTDWTHYTQNLNITSFYRLGLHPSSSSRLAAGAQDNNTSMNDSGNWQNLSGGDGMECQFDPDNRYIYTSSQYGSIYRYRSNVNGTYFFNGSLQRPQGEEGEWTTPFVVRNENVYAGFGNVSFYFPGSDVGDPLSFFTAPAGLNYPTPGSALAVNKLNDAVIYFAKRGYNSLGIESEVWRTTNGGNQWTKLSANLPNQLYPSYLCVKDNNPDHVWLTYSGFEAEKKVYFSKDGGLNWKNISYNLPNIPVNCVAYQNDSNAVVYIGTDLGVYYLDTLLEEWVFYSDGLPNVIVSELEVHLPDYKLVAATFGRGIWETQLLGTPDDTSNQTAILLPEESQIAVYPNPATEKVTLAMQDLPENNYQVRIISVTGKEVYSRQVHVSGNSELELNVSGFVPGEYFVILSTGNSRRVARLLVNR